MVKTVKTPKYKNFNGEVYTSDGYVYKYKSNAIDTANRYRKRGYKARIFKIPLKTNRWVVYFKAPTHLQDIKRFRKLMKQKRMVTKQARKQKKKKRKSKRKK